MTVNRCGHVVVLNDTTYGQLELIKKELDQRCGEVLILWKEAQDNADCTDQIDPDLDNLYNALENMCRDLEIEGYEGT